MEWRLQNLTDDPYVLVVDIMARAAEEDVELIVSLSAEIIIVDSDAPMYQVEEILDELGEEYERLD